MIFSIGLVSFILGWVIVQAVINFAQVDKMFAVELYYRGKWILALGRVLKFIGGSLMIFSIVKILIGVLP